MIPLVGGPMAYGEDIDFGALPDKFVLKANHGSGMNIIIKDKSKINKSKIIKTVNQWMNTLYGWYGMEVQYFPIERKIIAEQYIEQLNGNLLDYKIHCFNGKPAYFQIIGNRNLETHDGRLAWYDIEWKRCNFNSGDYPEYECEIDKPKQLYKLIEIAKTLSTEFSYVRIDLYVIGEKIYFGEMTFTPGNGYLPWKPNSADLELGQILSLPTD